MRSGFHQASRQTIVQIGTLTSALVGAMSLGGCVQMTRHSNMMIFGTNTVVGIRAGVNATSVPEVAIGYARQEAVVLPLVANTGDTKPIKSQDDKGKTILGTPDRLKPCNLTAPLPAPPADPAAKSAADGPSTVSTAAPMYAIHPCLLIATDKDGKMRDSFSVLASFGGTFKTTADAGGKTVSADGGVAQYFATGIAAQTLALNGGAAVVAGGSAAAVAADKAPITVEGITIEKFGATDPEHIILEKYLNTQDVAMAQHRMGLVTKVESAFDSKFQPDQIVSIIGESAPKRRQALINGLLVVEDQQAGKDILNGK